jgi:hypothetical protein
VGRVVRTLAKRECPESCVLEEKKTKKDPSCAARRRVGTIISLSLDVD